MISIDDDKAFVDGKQIKIGKFITKKEFRKFLVKEVKANRRYSCTSTHCPLAEATGYVVDGTDYGLIDWDGDLLGPRKILPAWAEDFVNKFDDEHREFPGLPKGKSAKRALFILDNAERMDKYLDNPDAGAF